MKARKEGKGWRQKECVSRERNLGSKTDSVVEKEGCGGTMRLGDRKEVASYSSADCYSKRQQQCIPRPLVYQLLSSSSVSIFLLTTITALMPYRGGDRH